MQAAKLKTTVAFIIFNRPDTTKRVFSEIAKARPQRLMVIADGPRDDRPEEAKQCEEARRVIEGIDWECELLTNFSDTNLGCKMRVSSGLDWVFENAPEAIILEDDCVPHPSFFQYCEELLERYRDDERVGMISGDNLQFGRTHGTSSYYFSRYCLIWGWATWRRAWKHYDRDIKMWPAFQENGYLPEITNSREETLSWTRIFDKVYENGIDTWDYSWVLTMWSQGMLSVLPQVNLISNVGFRDDATHTTEAGIYSEIPVEAMRFPLQHPETILRHTAADHFMARQMHHKPKGLLAKTRRKFIRKIKRLLR